jgi:hypothetical protein
MREVEERRRRRRRRRNVVYPSFPSSSRSFLQL